MAELNKKQEQFIREYLIDLNAKQAAIRAGYSPNTAEQQASRLLSHVKVKAAIDKALAERLERNNIDADYVLQRLVAIDEMDVADLLDNAGNIKPVKEWPKVWRTTISGFDLQELISGDAQSIIRKIKWPDKVKNLELLGKHANIHAFKDRVEHTGQIEFTKGERTIVRSKHRNG